MIAGNHHESAVYLDGTGQTTLGVEASEAFEVMSNRIVHFGHKGLTNAQMLLVATSDERLTRRENDGEAIVVFVGCL